MIQLNTKLTHLLQLPLAQLYPDPGARSGVSDSPNHSRVRYLAQSWAGKQTVKSRLVIYQLQGFRGKGVRGKVAAGHWLY